MFHLVIMDSLLDRFNASVEFLKEDEQKCFRDVNSFLETMIINCANNQAINSYIFDKNNKFDLPIRCILL